MALSTALTDLLKIEHPVLLAPMGATSGGKLAAAVTGAGGLGLLGGGYGDEAWIEREFAAAGNARVGIGFITWSLAQKPHLLARALERKPAAVMLSFGDVRPFARQIKDSGAKLICQVQTVAMARDAVRAGADIVVAQGTEAGGHGAGRSTFALVPAVVDAVAPVPVVAAGGVADGRGLAAALMLGAAGVLMGTRFCATDEWLGHDNQKKMIVAESGDATTRTTVFDIVRRLDWPGEFTGRAIRNGFLNRWHGREADLGRAVDAEAQRYIEAQSGGDFDTAVVFAGEGIDMIRDVRPAADVVAGVVAEARALLDRAAGARRP